MSSRPPRPAGRRPALSVWLRRRWSVVWAWRLLLAPIIPDPPRDPSLRDALYRAKGNRCSTCGERTASWQAEHSRPLGRGGKDALSNMTPMCVPCHQIKSAAEATVRSVSGRIGRLVPFLGRRPAPATSVFLVLFAAGMVTTRWVLPSLLALSILWFGPPLFRKYRPSFTGRSMGGGGFNRQPDFDRILEERQSGVTGRVSRTYWWWRRLFFSLRYVPMAAMVAYLAGVYVRHYGDDTALMLVRVLV